MSELYPPPAAPRAAVVLRLLLRRAGVYRPAGAREALQLGQCMGYQLCTYLLLSVVEDPAWLAWALT